MIGPGSDKKLLFSRSWTGWRGWGFGSRSRIEILEHIILWFVSFFVSFFTSSGVLCQFQIKWTNLIANVTDPKPLKRDLGKVLILYSGLCFGPAIYPKKSVDGKPNLKFFTGHLKLVGHLSSGKLWECHKWDVLLVAWCRQGLPPDGNEVSTT